MALFAVLIPTTILIVIGYFVLVASAKSDGSIRAFGRYLSIWIFALAGLVVIGAATAPMFGGHPFGMRGMSGGAGMHEMMRDHAMRGAMRKSEDVTSSPTSPTPETAPPVPPEEPKH